LIEPTNGVVRHRGRKVPARVANVWVDGCGIAEEVRLPLVRVTADEAIEILEAHANRPLIKRSGLARKPSGRVVFLAKPRRAIAVIEQNPADRRAIPANDTVVAGKAGRGL